VLVGAVRKGMAQTQRAVLKKIAPIRPSGIIGTCKRKAKLGEALREAEARRAKAIAKRSSTTVAPTPEETIPASAHIN